METWPAHTQCQAQVSGEWAGMEEALDSEHTFTIDVINKDHHHHWFYSLCESRSYPEEVHTLTSNLPTEREDSILTYNLTLFGNWDPVTSADSTHPEPWQQ